MSPEEQSAGHIQRFLNDPSALNIPWCDSPFFEHQLSSMGLSDADAESARSFARDGYLILEDVADKSLIDRILKDYPRLFDPNTDFGVDEALDSLLKRDPKRRQDAWAVNKDIRKLACQPELVDKLRFLYRREPIPFQTLNFLPGTEQSTHSDAMHFSSIPRGFMCGIWIPFEDVNEDNGPLHYYPGSHRLPEIALESLGLWPAPNTIELGPNYDYYEDYVRAVAQAMGLEQKRLTVPKGTALIWAYNLLHGGCPVIDHAQSRKSQVTHYYFQDCIYYGPIHSDVGLGELRLRHVYDILRDCEVPHSLNGKRIEPVAMPNGNHRIGLPGFAASVTAPPAASLRGMVANEALNLVRSQIDAVLADRKLRPAERATTLARLAEVALKASERAEG